MELVDENVPITKKIDIAIPSYINFIARKNDIRRYQANLQCYGVLEEIVEA